MNNKILVDDKKKGERLDVFISEELNLSRSQAQKMVKKGQVLLEGKTPKKAGQKLKYGDLVEVCQTNKRASAGSGGPGGKSRAWFKIKVLAETEDYLVIEKPAGLLMHQTEAKEPESLAAWILENYPQTKDVGEYENRPGIVHRLDKEASGLVVIAKKQEMFVHLKKQFKKRQVEKEYLVLAHGRVEREHDTINFDISRSKDGRMAARPKTDRLSLRTITKIQPGKEAVTEFWVEKIFSRYTLLRVKIHTGRTHQIRVHLLAYNHPVAGDAWYANRKLNLKKDKELGRLFLHASKLCFCNLGGEKVCFEAELAEELKRFLQELN
ncbi:MAG: RluA family pseudouridine synthase [Patescibacteria group bacterium]